jgi:hypothetical protein
MDFKKYTRTMTLILIILSIIIIVFGLLSLSKNIYAGIVYLVIGALQFLGAIFVYPRITKVVDTQEVGNRAVQHFWLILSVGIAGMALFLAPFFKIEPKLIPYISFIIVTLSVILGGLSIMMAVRKVKARMVV